MKGLKDEQSKQQVHGEPAVISSPKTNRRKAECQLSVNVNGFGRVSVEARRRSIARRIRFNGQWGMGNGQCGGEAMASREAYTMYLSKKRGKEILGMVHETRPRLQRPKSRAKSWWKRDLGTW